MATRAENEPSATERARELRRVSTFPERLLWSRIRNQSLGWKFRRQHPIGPFFADFCCPELRLVIEVDGRSHRGAEESDRRRQAFIEAQGFRVERVSNDAIVDGVGAVVRALARICGEQAEKLKKEME